ncbi:biopolymer transporter ExbD [Chromatium okenii]|uniref:ExbD/TolR family protein n=1 Tax=Chromatium okenii TaxID=61644 RepID=UPI0026EE2DD4|nr:biopolymer transporter ExbD [Chromatium okenii]MBV5307851.1 biopolymer transporter ExbD [Chromatium okenii]
MSLRPRRRPPIDINIAPLIDVVFLLLIFFMVSTTFRDETRLRVQLPQAQGESLPADAPTPIRLVIDQAGHYFINDQAIENEIALAQRLTQLSTAQDAQTQIPVLIQADAQTPHQAVMTALDVAGQTGLKRIIFAATHRQ